MPPMRFAVMVNSNLGRIIYPLRDGVMEVKNHHFAHFVLRDDPSGGTPSNINVIYT